MPSRPVPPSLDRRSELRATWDLLSRPDGFSLRRTYRMFVAAHGRPNELWFRSLLVDPTFVVYAPLVDTHDGRAGMDLAALPPLGRGSIDPEAALQARAYSSGAPGHTRRQCRHPTHLPSCKLRSTLLATTRGSIEPGIGACACRCGPASAARAIPHRPSSTIRPSATRPTPGRGKPAHSDAALQYRPLHRA